MEKRIGNFFRKMDWEFFFFFFRKNGFWIFFFKIYIENFFFWKTDYEFFFRENGLGIFLRKVVGNYKYRPDFFFDWIQIISSLPRIWISSELSDCAVSAFAGLSLFLCSASDFFVDEDSVGWCTFTFSFLPSSGLNGVGIFRLWAEGWTKNRKHTRRLHRLDFFL